MEEWDDLEEEVIEGYSSGSTTSTGNRRRPSPSLSSTLSVKARRKQRISTVSKLERTTAMWRSWHWSLEDFMRAYLTTRKCRSGAKQQRIANFQRVVRRLDKDRVVSISTELEGYVAVGQLESELDALVGQEFFDMWTETQGIEDMEFERISTVVQTFAPSWYSLLTRLLRNTRAHRSSYQAGASSKSRSSGIDSQVRQMYLITSIFCHNRAQQKSNLLYHLLGIYLYGNGIRSRSIGVLNGFGLCPAYSLILKAMRRIEEQRKVRLPTPIPTRG